MGTQGYKKRDEAGKWEGRGGTLSVSVCFGLACSRLSSALPFLPTTLATAKATLIAGWLALAGRKSALTLVFFRVVFLHFSWTLL